MLLPSFEKLPKDLQVAEVMPYYEVIRPKWVQLIIKRIMDIVIAILLLAILLLPMLVIAIAILIDSGFPILYKQKRVTQFGRNFYIYKFRTMVVNADKIGSHVTLDHDPRITRMGTRLRNWRFDEMPQVLNLLFGDMTLVGTRPEVVDIVKRYTPEMRATLLLPAGLTSRCSILYKDEAKLMQQLKTPEEADALYMNRILPDKMKINLEEIQHFSLARETKVLIDTILTVVRK
ncbi:MAG: sugar transferase [Peptoniphilaceae bacterium]|nr:sugar transferase [Peptoniphilaceae bacterium]MDY5765789.1 sugar transferase [Peptoniphilaceae bacterium]